MEMSFTFRNAVALNNIGVLLLNRRCYNQALATLNDAVTLLKHSSQHDDGTYDDLAVDYRRESVEKHHLALQRLSQPEVCTSQDFVSIEILRTSEQLLEDISSSASDMRNCPTLFPIRIEEIDFNYRMEGDIDFESGIVLHNYAIAHFCLWKSKTLSRLASRQSHYNCAIKLLQMSYNVCSKSIDETENDVLSSHPKLLQVKAVILGTLVKSLKCSPSSLDQIAAETFRSVLADIKSAVSEMEKANALLFGDLLTTAAAA